MCMRGMGNILQCECALQINRGPLQLKNGILMKSVKFQNLNFYIIIYIYIYIYISDKFAIFEIRILIMKKMPNSNGSHIFFS